MEPRSRATYASYLAYPIFFAALIWAMPRSGHGGDVASWVGWTEAIRAHGVGYAYSYAYNCNYLPLYLYVLKLFGWLQPSTGDLASRIHWLKAVILAFDFLSVFLILELKRPGRRHLVFASLLLLNPAFLYDTLAWGQIDSMCTSLVLASVIFAAKRRPLAAFLALLLASNVKPLAVVFVPMIALMASPDVIRAPSARTMLIAVALLVGTELVLLLPFLRAGEVRQMIEMVTSSVDRYPVVSANAFNFWGIVFEGRLFTTADSETILGISYAHWGTVLWAAASIAAVAPLALDVREKSLEGATSAFDAGRVMLTATLVALSFFFFNTRMHERYSHPAVVFAAAYGILSGRYLLYALASAGHLLNLAKVLQSPKLEDYPSLIVRPRFVGALFAVAIVYGFVRLYEPTSKSCAGTPVVEPSTGGA